MRPEPEPYQPRLQWWEHAWRFVAMLLISAAAASGSRARWPEDWLPVTVDLGLGLVSFVLVHFRRRAPFLIAVVTTLFSAGSAAAAGPAVLASVSLATRRRWQELVTIGVLGVLASIAFETFVPTLTDPLNTVSAALTGVIVTAACLAWGMYIGSRRELVWTLRERADRAESEQELRMQRARNTERTRIAREMHDVLAHRISRISMHAGALAFREDLGADQLRSGAVDIRSQANQALDDLRGLLGVLRDPDTGEPLDQPQPTYADVPALVEEARESGLRVAYSERLPAGASMPEGLGRTVYRIVQEGITNARKHAPGAALDIVVRGSPEDGVDVRLRNPLGFHHGDVPGPPPGAGLGLIGLAERAALRGGRLEHGRDGECFVLRGWLPWAA